MLIEYFYRTTSNIKNLKNRPCLLSHSSDPGRNTQYTVEAISLDSVNTKNKKWIGLQSNKIKAKKGVFMENANKEVSEENSLLKELEEKLKKI